MTFLIVIGYRGTRKAPGISGGFLLLTEVNRYGELPQNRQKRNLPLFPKFCYNPLAALLQSGNRKEVSALELLTKILVSVVANVISHYIRKWLDRCGKGK